MKCPFYHPSSFDWEQEIKDISIAIIEGREILDVSKNVVIRNLVWAINNRTKPQTELADSSSISSEHHIVDAHEMVEMIDKTLSCTSGLSFGECLAEIKRRLGE